MTLFGLGRKPTTFGLDIGTSAIKVVELAQSKGGLALKTYATVPLPRDVIAEGTIREPQVVTDAIKECVEKAGISGTSAVISVSGREAIVKRVPLPTATPQERGDAIQLEAEHHIPFAIDDVFLDYQVVSQSANAMSVVLVATKKVKVLEYVAAVEAAGMDAVVVDLDAFAVQNQFELSSPGEATDAVALIDIGASVMKTNVIHGGACICARDVPGGGNTSRDPSARRLKVATEVAEAARRGREVGVNWDNLVPALEAVSRELSLEVQRTFDYFASPAESERIGLTGLDGFLGSSWGVPVELARPFQGIEHDAAQFADEDPEQIGPVLAVAVGAALRRPGGKPPCARANPAPP